MPRQTLKQRADGRYRVKYQNKYFYGATQREAYASRDAYIRMLEAGLKQETYGMTVEAYSQKWVSTYKSHLSDDSFNTHVRLLNRFCSHDNIGAKRLLDVTTSDIQSFYNTAQGMSKSYICSMRDTVRGLFKYALADRLIQYDPTIKAALPKGKKGTHRAITPHERSLIHGTAHALRPLVMTMLYAGLRRGEALALNIDRDVDFFNQTITVREAVHFVGQNQAEVKDPKTEAGVRTIPLLDILSRELKGRHGLLISTSDGSHISQSSWKRLWQSYINTLCTTENGIQRRWYGRTKEHKSIIAAGGALPPWVDISIRSHDLRHSYCTMLYDAGVDLKSAMLWMGHADQEMTMQIYTHLSDKRKDSSAAMLRSAVSSLYDSSCSDAQ